ncbi:SulP family inorganic anion transporter [Nocardiopsis changdeensis]|uniref:SulP family inorganic anion transporter n=1 Tax=Nocardiopsis changdeensis TaxID=2831969 RepID=A0ABX8BMC1_9ACTN|nr:MULTISPECIES: SulP family inorganic anion transporter [Nocardiopsis]QUX22454.1 SulP family inorganic anion transporter [Nocardiopsis changdeensis]QYX38396.1 SulP family inorganic anion transporter [Nocardiopsis sp. MT53]
MGSMNPPVKKPRSLKSRIPAAAQLRADVLAGLVVALALIPEAIAFSLIAGVDPRVGLYASFVMAVSIAFLGGRPAMISAATGAMALVAAPLSIEYGVDHLIAATLLAGLIQIGLGLAGVAKLMRFVPPSVMTGFINALAILIFLSQMPYLADFDIPVYVMVAVGLGIVFGLPYLTKAVPAPLVAIVVLTVATITMGISTRTVGDEGELPDFLPVPLIPDVPFSLDTLVLIAPYSLTLALVGLMESLMTAKVVDDRTETSSDHGREARGQGMANILVGLFGGMAGCAMIGQTMINVSSGARTRVSTFLAGVFLMVLCVGLGDIVGLIPMAALVAVMIFVSAVTFDWHSIAPATLRRMPWSETLVMVITVAVVVATHNLALGVIAGVVVSMVLFAGKAAMQADVTSVLDPDGGTRVYSVSGEVFFASSGELVGRFDYTEQGLDRVVVDMSAAHVWDSSAVAALDRVREHFRGHGVEVEVTGLNESSSRLHRELSGTLTGGH